MKPVELAPAARAELDEAAARYERERPGRGERFYAAVERAPRAYRIQSDKIRIDAIAHMRRRPGYWRDRVR